MKIGLISLPGGVPIPIAECERNGYVDGFRCHAYGVASLVRKDAGTIAEPGFRAKLA
jgi:hypothetical protein